MKTFLLLILTLLAFAGNSVLNRIALTGGYIDAQSFTLIRLVSGALALVLIVAVQSGFNLLLGVSFLRNFKGAIALFLYAITFSIAYLTLDTGTGALILFGVVQILLLALNFLQGNKLAAIEWFGVLLAISGLTVLLLPGASAPDLTGFILMFTAGVAWGLYTYWGRGSRQPLVDTSANFIKTLPLCLMLFIWWFAFTEPKLVSVQGVGLAIISGAVTSGIGYAVWYAVLPKISILQSALSQLLVPVFAAGAGILFLGEQLTVLFVITALMTLGGIGLIQLSKIKARKN